MATKNLTRLYLKFRDNHKTQQQRDTPKKDLFKTRAKNVSFLVNDYLCVIHEIYYRQGTQIL